MEHDGLNGTLPGGRTLSGEEQQKLRNLAETQAGQRVRSLLGDEARLTDAIRRGDTAALQKAMSAVMRDPAGRSFLESLSGLMGKP